MPGIRRPTSQPRPIVLRRAILWSCYETLVLPFVVQGHVLAIHLLLFPSHVDRAMVPMLLTIWHIDHHLSAPARRWGVAIKLVDIAGVLGADALRAARARGASLRALGLALPAITKAVLLITERRLCGKLLQDGIAGTHLPQAAPGARGYACACERQPEKDPGPTKDTPWTASLNCHITRNLLGLQLLTEFTI